VARYADQETGRSDPANQVRCDVIRPKVNSMSAVCERKIRAIVDKDLGMVWIWQGESLLK
jgi:hypothetical protein